MDTANAISSRGHSTTLATGSYRASCLHTLQTDGSHIVRPTAAARITIVPPAALQCGAYLMCRLPTREQHPACACAGVQTAKPPDHFNASMAASAARHDLSDSLRSGTLASRDLAASEAAIGATNQLAAQVASMGLGKVPSETSPAHAESSTSSIGRRGADVFSRLSSIGKSRRPEKSASAFRNRKLPARPPPRFRHHERSAFTWTVKDDQRLRDLTIEQEPNHSPGITPAPNGPAKGLTVENTMRIWTKSS